MKKPKINGDMCMKCGACVGSCPVNAMFLREYIVEVNDDCTGCGLCKKICPVGAVTQEE